MEFSAEQIAGIILGEIIGDSQVKVNGLAKIEEGSEGKLSFLANTKYEEYIYSTGSSICIVNTTFTPSKPLPENLTLIKVEDAYACFAQLLVRKDGLCEETFEAVVDYYPKMDYPATYMTNDIHPTQQGYKLIAEEIKRIFYV